MITIKNTPNTSWSQSTDGMYGCVCFTWSLEVDSAQLHRVSGMVGRHGFAAGETAFPALSLGPFPGITDQ